MNAIKKLCFGLITLTTAVVLLNACQKKDDGGGGVGATPAATPPAPVPVQTCNVTGNTTCNPGTYQQFGPQMQPYQGSYVNGFCGCQSGFRPVMNSQWGISCAPADWFPGSSYYGYNYHLISRLSTNNQWMAIPQITYSPAISGTGNNCYSSAASVCDIRNANSCASGGVCRPAGGGSYFGFCTHGTGTESYVSQVCNWELNQYGQNVRVCRDNYSSGNAGGGTIR